MEDRTAEQQEAADHGELASQGERVTQEGCESPLVKGLIGGVAVCLTLLAIAWAVDIPYYAGFAVFTEQFIATMLSLALALVFLSVGIDRKPRVALPWYDAIAAFCGLAGGLYIAVRYRTLIDELALPPVENVAIGVALLVLLIEGLRRTAGPVLVFILLMFLAYAFFGSAIPGALTGRFIPADRLIVYLTMEEGIVARPLIIASTIIVAFIFFGQLLFVSGGSGYFTDLAMSVMGRFRGGSAKIAIISSALFGSISGSAVANVAATGVVTIPLMTNGGYTRQSAGAIEAVASTGGQLMPPVMGATAFLMAEYLEIPYRDVAIAALLPAILYFVSLFIQADLEAGRQGIGRVDERLIPKFLQVFVAGWLLPLPFVVLIVGLFVLHMPPDMAAFYAAATLVVLVSVFGYKGRRLSLRDILLALRGTGLLVVEIIMITSAAGIIIGILNLTGLGFAIPLALTQSGFTNPLMLAALCALISIILGMGMPTLGVYVLLAGLVAPLLVRAGISPIAAHMFVLYFGVMSMITPPVALAAFAAATIAKSNPMLTGLSAVRFGWPAYLVPFLFLFSPAMLLDGPWLNVAMTAVTAIGGVFLVSIGVAGYLVRPLGYAPRLIYVVTGVSLLTPPAMFSWAVELNVLGFCVGTLLIGREVIHRRLAKPE